MAAARDAGRRRAPRKRRARPLVRPCPLARGAAKIRAVPRADIDTIDLDELTARLARGGLLVLDVLAPAQHAAGHLPGAVSAPLEELDARIAALAPAPDAEIVVSCSGPTGRRGPAALERLRQLGFTNVRLFAAGLEEWVARGLPLESVAPRGAARPDQARPERSRGVRFLVLLNQLSTRRVLFAWLWMVLGCGLAFWLLDWLPGHGLAIGGRPVETGPLGLLTTLYFSLVTATSVGYGDVVPLGVARVLAMGEAVSGLLLFGVVISKLVSWRQERLVEDIHALVFEDRLDRVQTNLHLMIADLQDIGALRRAGDCEPGRVAARMESATMVFAGELRAVHSLLFRPRETPDEEVLQSILASLASALRELLEVLESSSSSAARTSILETNLRTLARLADEICGECVPNEYAPGLRAWMDRVREQAARLS